MRHLETGTATTPAKLCSIDENIAGLDLTNVDAGRIKAAANANKARAAAAERDCHLNHLPESCSSTS